MKKCMYFSFIIIISIFLYSCSKSTEPSNSKIPIPKNKYEIDVKSQFVDKMAVTGAKNGLIGYLNSSTWATVVNTGEDYELWVKDPVRKNLGSKYNVYFTLDLKKSTVWSATLVKTTIINVSYDINDDFEGGYSGINGEKFVSFYKNYEWIINLFPGANTVTGIIDKLLPYITPLMTDGEDDQQKAESVIVGAAAYKQTLLWFNEIEAGKK